MPVDVVAPRLTIGEAGWHRRHVGQIGVLAEHGHGVDPEPFDTTIEPEHQHAIEVVDDVWRVPVEVGLPRREGVQVPLARGAVGLGDPRPCRTPEDRPPVVRRLVAVGPLAVAEPVASALR